MGRKTMIYKPKTKEELVKIINEQFFDKWLYDLNDIDTSLITDMSNLFYKLKFSFDVSRWNTKNVESMKNMFWCCTEFNSDVSGWKTGKVTDMCGMFRDCRSFNQDIGNWETGNVENMRSMFLGCQNFNQDLSRWNIGKVRDMSCMFSCCPLFNQDLSNRSVRRAYSFLMLNESYKEEWKPKYYDLYGNNIT